MAKVNQQLPKFTFIRHKKPIKINSWYKRSESLSEEQSSECQQLNVGIPYLSGEDAEFKCDACNKIFSTLGFLNRHKRNYCYREENEDLEEGSEVSSCANCSATFVKKSNFFAHMQRTCKDMLKRRDVCPFPQCRSKFSYRLDMSRHLAITHWFEDILKEFRFSSWDEFYDWKKRMEGCTLSYGSKWESIRTTSIFVSYYFGCKFGQSGQQKGWGHQRSKVGSVFYKSCPSRIKVQEFLDDPSKQLIVTHYKSHYHPLNFKDVVHRSDSVARLDSVATSVQKGASTSQIHYVTKTANRSDTDTVPKKKAKCDNNQSQLKLNQESKKIETDATAVEDMVQELIKEKFNPVVVYKPQGVTNSVIGSASTTFDSDVFLLGLQTERQQEMLVEGSTRILCFDTSYKTNVYNFFVTNLIVPDQFGRGYPVAHFIMSKLDVDLMSYCFKELVSSCKNLVVNAVLTLDNNVYCVVVPTVFGDDIPHFICKRQTIRNWKKNINSKVKDPARKQEIYQDLYVMLEEKNGNDFKLCINCFKNKYAKDCPQFYNFFKKEYLGRVEQWSMSARNFPHGDQDTNGFCDGFNILFKKTLGRGSQNTIEILITTLLEMERERFITYQGQLFYNPMKMNPEFDKRHKKGMRIPDYLVAKESATSWSVQSQTKPDSYIVSQINEKCFLSDHCFYTCNISTCGDLCSHMYSCNCRDPSLCKHIHKVRALLVKESLQKNGKNDDSHSYDSDGAPSEPQSYKSWVQPSYTPFFSYEN